MGQIIIEIPQSVNRNYQIIAEDFLPKLENLVAKAKKVESETDLGLTGENAEKISVERMDWLKKNREKYAGKYVALNGNKLVGVGKTIREAHHEAKQNGVNNPFLVRVSSENETLSGGL